MEKIKLSFTKFFKANRPEVLALIVILLVSAFVRLYRIEGQMTFLGDEGRDVRVVRNLLHGDIVAIGPQTSIGNMYLGPLYYYMMAPALLFSNYNPVGPSVMVALLGVLTVAFTWYVGRAWFSPRVGLIAALLLALSPVAIIYSRASWNPNPMPFFALLCIWGMYQVIKNRLYKWLVVVGASFAFALHMHYLALLLIPTIGLPWVFTLRSVWKEPKNKSLVIRYSILGIILFLFLMSPLVFFDLKHDGMNFKAFKAFFSDRQTTININPARSDRFGLILNQLVTDFVLSKQIFYSSLVGIVLIVTGAFSLLKQKNRTASLILFSWAFFGFIGLVVYKQHVYDHYYGFLFPAIYLFLAVTISFLLRSRLFLKLAGLSVLITIITLNIIYSPTKDSPNNQLQRTEKITKLIIDESKGQSFNFGLIAKQNYDESYRYFLEMYKAKMIRGEDKVTDQLFAVCEDGDKCQPLNNPQYQIAIFGPASISGQWQVDYIKIYRLIHTK